MKKLRVILLFITLSECSSIVKVEKINIKDNFENPNNIYNEKYLNSDNIIKILGEPASIKKEGEFEYLEYITKGELVENNDSYSYTIKLKNNKIEEINKDVYKQIAKKVDNDFIKQLNGQVGITRERDKFIITNIPFEKKECENEMIKNTKFQADFMNGVKNGTSKYCATNRLLDMEHFTYTITGHKYYWQSVSKFFSLDVFAYNKNILNISNFMKNFEEKLKNTKLQNSNFVKKNEKINNYSCEFITKTGEDYDATNKFKNSFLLYKEAQGVCYNKDVIFIVGVSIRYPESLKEINDPLDEIKQTIKSLKFN